MLSTIIRTIFSVIVAAILVERQALADTTITILTHYTDAQRSVLTPCLKAYERDHPGVHIVHQQAEIEDYLQTVMIGRLSGTSPDIYNIYSIWSAQLVAAKLLDVPPPDVSRLIESDYAPSTVEAIKVADKVWGIPAEVATFMLIYNKKLFQQAGIASPPQNWNDVVNDAARITRRNAQRKITTTGFAFGPTIGGSVYPFMAMLFSRGLEPLDVRHDTTRLAEPAAVNVLADQTRLFMDGITDTTIQVRDFPRGSVGMMIFANWYKDTLQQAFGADMDNIVGVAPIPGGPDWKTLQYAFFWAVDANSPRKTQAWDLLTWLNTSHVANQQSCTGAMLGRLGALTANRHDIAAGQSEYGDAFSKPFAEAIASGRASSLPNVLRATEIQEILRLAISEAWTGVRTPDVAFQDANRKITAILTDGN